MKKDFEFLQINDKPIYTILKDGQWWVALKPLCEALEVNYNRQFQNVKKHHILKAVFANQQIQIPNDQVREMVCLPEKYIYGWLFSLQSKSPALIDYHQKCYDLLYEYFHGTVIGRQQVLQERITRDKRILELEIQLQENETYKELLALKKYNGKDAYKLRKMDNEMISRQRSFF